MDLGTRWRIAAVAAVAAAAGACGSAPMPTNNLARSQAAIRSAQVMGAEQNPSAALHLRLAQEQFQQAKKKIEDGDNERARYLLLRAEADADVAQSLMHEVRAKEEAARLMQQIQALQASQGRGS